MLNYLILGALFFVLSPGNFLTLPRGGSKMTVALVHAVVFVVAYYLFEMLTVEGFQAKKKMQPTPTLTPMQQLQRDYSSAKRNCIYLGELKDKEYNKGRTNTKRFIQLESSQRQICDKANELRNKLRDSGIEVEGFQGASLDEDMDEDTEEGFAFRLRN